MIDGIKLGKSVQFSRIVSCNDTNSFVVEHKEYFGYVGRKKNSDFIIFLLSFDRDSSGYGCGALFDRNECIILEVISVGED